jgi:hypothetical protein
MMVRFQFLVVAFLLLRIWPAHAVDVIESAAYRKPDNLVRAIELLRKTPSGREIYARAVERQVPIREGKISKTEITATRTVQGTSERLNFVVQVLISQDKEPVFQALDLAHELVHAVNEKKNPFDPKLNASEYIQHGIEGKGGEAEAIAEECKVGHELVDLKTELKDETARLIKARCQYVWKLEKDDSKWKKSFYQLGQYYRGFVQAWLGTQPAETARREWTDKLEARTPIFSSAAAHKPYPVALLEEYLEVTRIICDRAMRSRVGRGIASFTAFEARCKAIRNK